MTKGHPFVSMFGIAVAIGVVFGSLVHANHTDPVGHETTASVAIHGVVIPPFTR